MLALPTALVLLLRRGTPAAWCSTAWVGLDYLVAGAIALLLVIAGLAVTPSGRATPRRRRRRDECSVRARCCSAGAANPAPAQDDGKLPASVEELFEEKGDGRQARPGERRSAGTWRSYPRHTRNLRSRRTSTPLTVGGAKHLKALLSLELSSQTAAIVLFGQLRALPHRPRVAEAHPPLLARPKGHGHSAAHLNLKDLVSDVHFRRGLSCAGCHGGLARQRRDDRGHRCRAGPRRTCATWTAPGFRSSAPAATRTRLHARLQPFPAHRPARQVPATASTASSCSRSTTPRRRSA